LKGSASYAQEFLTGDDSPFRISAGKELSVEWKGQPLIAGDAFSWINDQPIGVSAKVFEVSEHNGWQTVNAWADATIAPYRREIGLSPDGKKIEWTFQAHQNALMDSYPSPHIAYTISLPATAFANATWDALTGGSFNSRWSNGQLDPSMPDGVIASGTRWITFNTPNGPITFDFNPHGVTTYYVGGINTMVSQRTVTKKGDRIEISFSTPATHYGGDFTGKFTLFEGDKDDYLKHHAATSYHYFSELKKEQLFTFNQTAGKDFTQAGTRAFDPAISYGWQHPDGLSIQGGTLPGALYAACASSRMNTFLTQGLRPGLYLITLKSSALDKDVGPFAVSLNGEEVFSDIKVKKGKVADMTFVRWIEQGEAELQLKGDWAVSVIGYQLFMHREEDFEFRRGNWLKDDGFCPGVLFANYYDTPPLYGKSVAYSTLAGVVKEVSEVPTFPELETALPDQQADELAWRFNSPLGTMGPDNWGTFNEFNTPAKLEQRLKEIKEGGVNAVILNGLLSRHTYQTHLGRVEETIRETVEIAHRMGMKIIDHQDLTVLWNADMGFRFLAAYPGYLQHNHSNGLPTWGICPANKDFNDDHFFPFISNHIKKTGIDGLMMDEACFHYNNFCNCSFCRDDFTKISGLVLPDDETSPLLHNRSSALWKTWIEWRKHAMAQWRIDLSKLTHQINPYLSNLQYYSEGGFLYNAASYGQGGDLPLSAKSMDFLGTEIMSRDVWDDYRYNLTSRNMYNSLRETYGSPVFGLVYPAGVFNYALIGWAMNNMHGQVTWSLADFDNSKKMNDYTGWKENMNKITSTPYTNIALVFSRSTRDWSVKNTANYPKEIMGMGQFLAERHIPHTFILDDAITIRDLSGFKTLLAPGMDCVSDEQGERLKQFVRDGGVLFLTGDAGIYTPFGADRNRPIFSDILTDSKLAEAAETDWVEAKYGKGRIVYARNKSMMNEFCASNRETGMVYRFSPDPKITASNEKIWNQIAGTGLFKPIHIPQKVLVTAYKDETKGRKAVMVHLLNAMGVKMKDGDALPLPDPTWEPIPDDLRFEIVLPSFKNAYYASPDAEGHKPVDVKNLGKNRYQVTIPKGTVDKYGIVYLFQK
jgi:hypothetical protein